MSKSLSSQGHVRSDPVYSAIEVDCLPPAPLTELLVRFSTSPGVADPSIAGGSTGPIPPGDPTAKDCPLYLKWT